MADIVAEEDECSISINSASSSWSSSEEAETETGRETLRAEVSENGQNDCDDAGSHSSLPGHEANVFPAFDPRSSGDDMLLWAFYETFFTFNTVISSVAHALSPERFSLKDILNVPIS